MVLVIDTIASIKICKLIVAEQQYATANNVDSYARKENAVWLHFWLHSVRRKAKNKHQNENVLSQQMLKNALD